MWLGGAVNICGKAVAGPQKKSVTSKIEHFCSREAAYSKKKSGHFKENVETGT